MQNLHLCLDGDLHEVNHPKFSRQILPFTIIHNYKKLFIFFPTEIYYNTKETLSQSNPIREHVDVTKPNLKYIKPYIEEEVHPNPSVRVSQLFVYFFVYFFCLQFFVYIFSGC